VLMSTTACRHALAAAMRGGLRMHGHPFRAMFWSAPRGAAIHRSPGRLPSPVNKSRAVLASDTRHCDGKPWRAALKSWITEARR